MRDALFNRILDLPLFAHATSLVASAGLFVWVKGQLDASYAASRHPVDYATGQTSFSAEAIKGWYQSMTDTGTLDVYMTTQLIDFGFIAALMLLGLFGGLLLSKLSRPSSLASKAGRFAATVIPVGGLFDALENLISFVMLADPTGFADWIALPYSAAASVKFACITAGMVAALFSIATNLLGRIINRPAIG